MRIAIALVASFVPTAMYAEGALEVFDRRIRPILSSERPSSCTECHLSGVDLKDYIKPTQAETFAALRSAGLIDVDSPDESKLLAFIARMPDEPTLVSAAAREQEYEAFRAWIRAAVKDRGLLDEESTAAIGPAISTAVIRHTRLDRVQQAFREQVWSEVSRCAGCHMPGLNDKQVAKFGESVSWIDPAGPEQTLTRLVESGNINADDPRASPLLTKPATIDEHVGGKKLEIGDRTWTQFVRFLDDYAASKQGRYGFESSLPTNDTEITIALPMKDGPWIKLTGVPERWERKFFRVDIYRVEGDRVSPTRWAFAERRVFKGNLQQTLTLAAPRDTELAEQHTKRRNLPPGQYKIIVHADPTTPPRNTPSDPVSATQLVTSNIVESHWTTGFNRPTKVAWRPLRDAVK